MVNSSGHVWTVIYIATLFLGKPPRGNFPVLSAHSFTSNCQLALLETVEEKKIFLQKNVPEVRIDLGTAAYEVDMLSTELLPPVIEK